MAAPGPAPRLSYAPRRRRVQRRPRPARPPRPRRPHAPVPRRGLGQARPRAGPLAPVPLDAATTPDRPRPRQTADAVPAGRDLPRRSDPSWREIQTGKGGPAGAFDPVAIRAAILGS